MRGVRKLRPCNAVVGSITAAVQIHHRHIVRWRNGYRTSQRCRILRRFACTTCKIVVVTVIKRNAVSACGIRVVQRWVVGGAAVAQGVQECRNIGLIGTRVQIDNKRFNFAGACTINRATCCPSGAIGRILHVIARALYSSSCECSRCNAQYIARNISIGKRNGNFAAAKVCDYREEISIRHAGNIQQLLFARAAAFACYFNRCWTAYTAIDHRHIIISSNIERACSDYTCCGSNAIAVSIGNAEGNRARQRIGAVVCVRIIGGIDVGDSAQNRFVMLFGIGARQGQQATRETC